MRHWIILIPGVLGFLLGWGSASAQDSEPPEDSAQVICRFVDEDGDGFNDLAPDADGDGIPNGLDPDYVRSEDGEGHRQGSNWAGNLFSRMFGLMQKYQNSGLDQEHGPGSGPGVNAGFGPGEAGGNGSTGGEGQAQQAGRRGGRR